MPSVVTVILLPAWPLIFLYRFVKYGAAWLLALVLSCIWAILSFPMALCCAAGARMKRLWNFSKYHARQLLTDRSSPSPVAICEGTLSTGGEGELQDESEDGGDDKDECLALTLTTMAKGIRRRSRRDRRLSNAERRSMLETILKILLQPSSPRDSDDEEEMAVAALPSEHQGEAGQMLRLILDLVTLSNTRTGLPLESTGQLNPRDVAAMYQQVKERESLQCQINELNELTAEVDQAVLLLERKPKPLLVDDPATPETLTDVSDESESEEEVVKGKDNEQVQPECDNEDCQEDEPPVPYSTVLSPVQESPELSAYSSQESVSQMDCEVDTRDLDSILSDLNRETGRLEMLEQALPPQPECALPPPTLVTAVTPPPSRDPSQLSILPPSSTVTTKDNSTTAQPADSAEDKFHGFPQTLPFLGLKEGRERRDLATARKRRPPARWSTRPDQATTAREGDSPPAEDDSVISPHGSESEKFSPEDKEEEEGSHGLRVWEMADQIQLLKPGYPDVEVVEDDEGEETAESSVNQVQETKLKAEEQLPPPETTAEEDEKPVKRMRLGGDLSLNDQPPWLQMRQAAPLPPVHAKEPTPPPLLTETRTLERALSPMYDVLTPKQAPSDPTPPAHDPTYDSLQPKESQPPLPLSTDVYDSVIQPQYLHEAVRVHQPSNSPFLPPRNASQKSKSEEKKERSSRSREQRSSESKHSGKDTPSKKRELTSSTSRSRSRERSSSQSSRTSSEKRTRPAVSPSTSSKRFSASFKEKKQVSPKDKSKEGKSKSKSDSPLPKAKSSKSSTKSSPLSSRGAEGSVQRSSSKLSLVTEASHHSPSNIKKSTSLTTLPRHGSLRDSKQSTV